MKGNYKITVLERHEDHSEDEKTGGIPVSEWDNEYSVDSADIIEGAVFRVSRWTVIRILEVRVTEDSFPELRVSVTVGSSGSGYEQEAVLSVGHPVYVWDPLRWCDKYVELTLAHLS